MKWDWPQAEAKKAAAGGVVFARACRRFVSAHSSARTARCGGGSSGHQSRAGFRLLIFPRAFGFGFVGRLAQWLAHLLYTQ